MTARLLAFALLLVGGSAGAATADAEHGRCMERSDGTNFAWSLCGQELIAREDARLNAAWKGLFPQTEGDVKASLLAEQRAWNVYKEASCLFFAGGDFGREGQVLQFPICRAQVIADRTAQLEELTKTLSRDGR